MRLPKRLSAAVQLAAWCEEQGQRPAAVARLIVLAYRATVAAVRGSLDPERQAANDRKCENARQRFDAAAEALGYSTQWDCSWPTLVRIGSVRQETIHLPRI